MLFSISVKSFVLPPLKDVDAGSLVSVCFERGGKLVSSKENVIQIGGAGEMNVAVNEVLQMVSTMYRNNSGLFQVRS